MATGLGEEKLWIEISWRLGEVWALLSYSYPRHAAWVSPQQPKPD